MNPLFNASGSEINTIFCRNLLKKIWLRLLLHSPAVTVDVYQGVCVDGHHIQSWLTTYATLHQSIRHGVV